MPIPGVPSFPSFAWLHTNFELHSTKNISTRSTNNSSSNTHKFLRTGTFRPVFYWFFYVILAVWGLHFIVSVFGFVHLRSAVNHAKYGNSLVPSKYSSEKSSKKPLDPEIAAKFGCGFKTHLWLSLLFNFAIIRWFYSAKRPDRGALWYYDCPAQGRPQDGAHTRRGMARSCRPAVGHP